ncbi:hypothetical protein MSIBF_A2220004 [groundwater metagenome]|uniref:Uncharacterized protein n=1 Tax=groundwater metagenome TaxID=717931 RepID=A0A098E8M9_9ZZZZ
MIGTGESRLVSVEEDGTKYPEEKWNKIRDV